MCTIITVSKEFYKANEEGVLNRMRQDAVYNPHGFSILLLGTTEEEHVMMKSMDVETAILLVRGNSSWQRMFFHARFSTTEYVKLSDCHGFMTSGEGRKSSSIFGKDDWWTAHNGILNHDMADAFRVDSQYIPERLRTCGLNDTVRYLINEENYANVMMASIVTGKVVVTRAVFGSLMMDAEGRNFSSNGFSSINVPVPHKSYYHWTEAIKKTAVKTRTYTGYSSYTSADWGHPETVTDAGEVIYGDYTKDAEDYWTQKYGGETYETRTPRGHEFLDYWSMYSGANGTEDLRDDIKEGAFHNFDDFFDLAYEMGWISGEKVPNNVYKVLSNEQKGWISAWRADQRLPAKTGTEA